MLQFLIVSIVLSLALYARGKEVYTVEDVYVPNNCDKAAAVSDHLLIEYELVYHNGTVRASIKRPSQLLHIQLDDSV